MKPLKWWEALILTAIILLVAVAGALFIQVAIAQQWRWAAYVMTGLALVGLAVGSR